MWESGSPKEREGFVCFQRKSEWQVRKDTRAVPGTGGLREPAVGRTVVSCSGHVPHHRASRTQPG